MSKLNNEALAETNAAVGIIGSADGPTAVFVATPGEIQTTETTAVDDSPLGNIDPNPQNFVDNLKYMGIGMVGIFAVIAIIIGATVVMNKIFSGKKKQ